MIWNTSLTQWLLLLPVLLLSLTVHELSHGLAAYVLGDNTAKRQGRLSLNPIKHIDPIGFLLLVVAGFGWAKPVPVDPGYFKKPKQGMAITAVAGPLSNLILAFISTFIILATEGFAPIYQYIVKHVYPDSIVTSVLLLLIIYNCVLALFNLIPVPPLDGSKILAAFLPNRIYYKYLYYERYGMILMLLLVTTGVFSGALSRGVLYLIITMVKFITLMGIGV